MNVYTLFRDSSRDAGPFIVSPEAEVRFSYRDLDRISARLAAKLTGLGISPGDRVLAQVHKSPQALFLYFACLRVGAIYLPLNTAYQDEELAWFIEDAAPALIVCDPSRENFFRHHSRADLLCLDARGEGSLLHALPDTADFDTADLGDNDIAAMLYTSGTTGRPRGAMLSHGNLAVNALALHKAWGWQAGDVMLHSLPLFHVHGLFIATHLPVLGGSPIIFLPAFDPATVAGLLPRATVYMGVPTHYTRLLASGALSRETCRDMRLFISGSAPLPDKTFGAFRRATGHEIVERYGMTETGMNTTNPLHGPRKPGKVGPVLEGVSARITDTAGVEVPDGTPGRLLIKGENVFRGYWKLPDKTREAFTDDGFFITGDLASRDGDGYITIVGRDKDLIISGGLNVYPKEVESAIDRMDGVLESAVIGLPHDDFGEAVCAIVVREAGHPVSAADIIGDLKRRLANFKVPKRVYFEPELPRNAMGKVRKNLLRDRFAR